MFGLEPMLSCSGWCINCLTLENIGDNASYDIDNITFTFDLRMHNAKTGTVVCIHVTPSYRGRQ